MDLSNRGTQPQFTLMHCLQNRWWNYFKSSHETTHWMHTCALKVRCNIQLYHLHLTSHRLLHVELENTIKQGVGCNAAGPCAAKFKDITFGLKRVLCAGMCWCQYISRICIYDMAMHIYILMSVHLMKLLCMYHTAMHIYSMIRVNWSRNMWQLCVLTIA